MIKDGDPVSRQRTQNNNNALLPLIFVAMLNTACVLVEPKASSGEKNVALQCPQINAYQSRILQMTESELGKEVERLDLALDQDPSYCPSLQLAIPLSTPTQSYQEDRKAIQLLKKLQESTQLSPQNRLFIDRYLPHLQQRQQLRNLIGKLDAEKRSLENNNTVLQKQVSELERKIEQLKMLESEIEKKELSVNPVVIP